MNNTFLAEWEKPPNIYDFETEIDTVEGGVLLQSYQGFNHSSSDTFDAIGPFVRGFALASSKDEFYVMDVSGTAEKLPENAIYWTKDGTEYIIRNDEFSAVVDYGRRDTISMQNYTFRDKSRDLFLLQNKSDGFYYLQSRKDSARMKVNPVFEDSEKVFFTSEGEYSYSLDDTLYVFKDNTPDKLNIEQGDEISYRRNKKGLWILVKNKFFYGPNEKIIKATDWIWNEDEITRYVVQEDRNYYVYNTLGEKVEHSPAVDYRIENNTFLLKREGKWYKTDAF